MELRNKFMDTIVNDEKNINNEALLDYFKFQNPSLFLKDLYTNEELKRSKILCVVDDVLNDLGKDFNKKNIDRNEGSDKVIDIVGRILNFGKHERGKGFKILALKIMLQELTIALVQVKVGNTSEYLLNENLMKFDKMFITCIDQKE